MDDYEVSRKLFTTWLDNRATSQEIEELLSVHHSINVLRTPRLAYELMDMVNTNHTGFGRLKWSEAIFDVMAERYGSSLLSRIGEAIMNSWFEDNE